MDSQQVPLCVDQDGTLLKTDTLHELILRLVKREPWQALLIVVVVVQCLFRGKQHLKRYLAERMALPVDTLPVNHEFLAFLKQQHQAGRPLVLVTGCHERVAQEVARHFGFFREVIATRSECNLTGAHKAEELVRRFGEKGFDYAGNDHVDLPVWKKAREAILVNPATAAGAALQTRVSFSRVFDARAALLPALLKGVRLHQWAKNLLVFVPALTAHVVWQPDVLGLLLQAFIAFGCCASFSYIVNDLLDLEDDRKHHSKRHRPFASGRIGLPLAATMAVGLLVSALILALGLPRIFAMLLLLYFVTTNLYSFYLKRIPVLDVAVLAGLYTLRVLAGAVVIGQDPTFWLMAFSAFLFFSLAIVKRLSELLHLQRQGQREVKARGYIAEDISTLQGLGAASAVASVMVLALYINSDSVRPLYLSPDRLWLLCPVMLLWLGRVWLITGRGQMHDDPVVFALKDSVSWGILLVAAGIFLSATYL